MSYIPGRSIRKCKTCGYRYIRGDYRKYPCCQYILIEGKRRPCDGGNYCTAYKRSKVPFPVNDDWWCRKYENGNEVKKDD